MGVLAVPKRRTTSGLAPNVSVAVAGIEVTQAIQNLAHQVPLIAGKTTVVRVYLTPSGLSRTLEVRGEIAVAASPGLPARYVTSLGTARLKAQGHPSLDAQRRDASTNLNFLLPDNTVADVGGLSVHVKRLIASSGEEIALDPAGRDVTVTLSEAPPLRVRAIGLRYRMTRPDGSQTTAAPDALHFDHLRSYLRRAYPVPNVEWSQIVVAAHPLFAPPFSGPQEPGGNDPVWRAKLERAHNQLSALRAKDLEEGIDPRTHYYGLVSDAAGFFRGAANDIPQAPDPAVLAVGPVGQPSRYPGFRWDSDNSFGDWYGAHELAHTFGRFHPGFCNQDASDKTFPYPDGRISDSGNGDMIGFDVGDPTLQIGMRALDHETWHDIMTYCDHQWVSAHTYVGLLARLREEAVAFAPPSA